MNQEQEDTEEENNPPESLEPEHEQLEPETEPIHEPERSERPNTGSNNEFEFYFQFTKPLVLYLPSPDERAIAAAWVQKLEAQPRSDEERQLRLNYLKLLLFVLQRGHLTGVFRKQPSSGPLQPFPQGFTMMDMGNLMIDQSEAPGSGGGDGQAMPYSVEISNDLREFVAAQEIPNFGVQMYYAWSADEPVYKWNMFNEDTFPKYIIDKINLLKEVKSEENLEYGSILSKYCKKKPCDLPLLEKGPKSKVKSPEEIEKSQARSYQTYVGLVGRMGNAYKGICDDDQDKYNKPEQRKCRNQRTKRGMGTPVLEPPYDNPPDLESTEGGNPYYHQQAQGLQQGQSQVVCRCPPNYHLPNCEVRTSQMDRWQSSIAPTNPSGLATDAYVRGERSEQVEDVMEMSAPDLPYSPKMRPPSRGNERPFFRGPLTKKPEPPPSRKIKSQYQKDDDVAKKNEAVASKKGGHPKKPGSGKCYCTNQQCSCPCPRGPPPKGKRPVQSTTTAPQSNVPDTVWCPQPASVQPDPSASVPASYPASSLPAWARRGLEEQELLDPVTGHYTMPDMKYGYPSSQEGRPSRRRWKKIPPDQVQPCSLREPSPGMPIVPSQQMPSKKEEKIVPRPGPSTAPMVREENYPTTSKPTQKSLPGQSGVQQQGSFGSGTGGRLADLAGILAEIKQKTEAHKIRCKPVSARVPVEADVNVPRTLVQPQPQHEPILPCPSQLTSQPVPVHQAVPTPTKYGGAVYPKAPKRPEYYDAMEHRKRGHKVAKDLFGAKETFSKRTFEGIEPFDEEGECISIESMGDYIVDSSSSFECVDDQVGGTYVKKTQIQSFVPETPEQDATLTQDFQNQNQGRVRKFYTSTPKQGFFQPDISSIQHCGPIPPFAYSTPAMRPVQPYRRQQQPIDFRPYEPIPPPPGGTYLGTPDPRQPPEFMPIDTYQLTPQNQQRPPNDFIQNYEPTPYFPPAACIPESESGTFEPTLTPRAPLAQPPPTNMVPEMRHRSPERRNRSSSREREERTDDNCVEGSSRVTPRRKPNDTWATMQGEPISEREWGARREEITDWATMHGELICESEREGARRDEITDWATMKGETIPEREWGAAKRNEITDWATMKGETISEREWGAARREKITDWTTMHGELICGSESEGETQKRNDNLVPIPNISAPPDVERARGAAREAARRVDDWAPMHGELICENERDVGRKRREVTSMPVQCAPAPCEDERARKAAIREKVRQVNNWSPMQGELICESERDGARERRDVTSRPCQHAPASCEDERTRKAAIREAVRRVDDWAPMQGELICESERDGTRERRDVTSRPGQHAPSPCEPESSRQAAIREAVRRVDDCNPMHGGGLIPESEGHHSFLWREQKMYGYR